MAEEKDKLELALPKLLEDAYAAARYHQGIAIEEARDFSKSFDQVMVTLAAGSIAGSVSFIEKVTPIGRQWMTAAWILLALALLCILLSYQIGLAILKDTINIHATYESNLRQMEIAVAQENREVIKQLGAAAQESLSLTPLPRPRNQTVLFVLNNGAIAMLMIGVAFLLVAASHLK